MVIIGIDPSYVSTGVSIIKDNELVYAFSIDLKKLKTKPEKRIEIKKHVNRILESVKADKIIVERTRLFTQGMINQNVIMALSSISCMLCDLAFEKAIPIFSVDTRSWKSRIIGKPNTKGADKKLDTINYVKANFDETKIRDYTSDTCDAICIGMYGFLNGNLEKELNI